MKVRSAKAARLAISRSAGVRALGKGQESAGAGRYARG